MRQSVARVEAQLSYIGCSWNKRSLTTVPTSFGAVHSNSNFSSSNSTTSHYITIALQRFIDTYRPPIVSYDNPNGLAGERAFGVPDKIRADVFLRPACCPLAAVGVQLVSAFHGPSIGPDRYDGVLGFHESPMRLSKRASQRRDSNTRRILDFDTHRIQRRTTME